MQVTIRPSLPRGALCAPPSKSDAHRLLICAGLSSGESVIDNVALSDDVSATLDCLRAMGAQVHREGERVLVRGADPRRGGTAVYPCRACGSTLRFFLPLALLSGCSARFTGSAQLLARPMSVYEALCQEQGLFFTADGSGITVRGPLRGGVFTVDGSVSSQFVSGLLFALPLIGQSSVIRLRPPVESRPYIDMTRRTLSRFGIETFFDGETELRIPGAQQYRPGSHTVEGDWSNAAFFEALGARVTGLDENSLQGDKICRAYFRQLRDGAPTLHLADCPDLGPVCMVMAALHHGAVLTGTRRLKLKESDRGRAMACELAKCGVQVNVEDDRITVSGGARTPSRPLWGHGDHRIVMALSVLCSRTGGVIDGAEAVDKSLPDFFTRLQQLGIEVTANGMDQ